MNSLTKPIPDYKFESKSKKVNSYTGCACCFLKPSGLSYEGMRQLIESNGFVPIAAVRGNSFKDATKYDVNDFTDRINEVLIKKLCIKFNTLGDVRLSKHCNTNVAKKFNENRNTNGGLIVAFSSLIVGFHSYNPETSEITIQSIRIPHVRNIMKSKKFDTVKMAINSLKL